MNDMSLVAMLDDTSKAFFQVIHYGSKLQHAKTKNRRKLAYTVASDHFMIIPAARAHSLAQCRCGFRKPQAMGFGGRGI